MKERHFYAEASYDEEANDGTWRYDVPRSTRFKANQCKCGYTENEDGEEISENQDWSE